MANITLEVVNPKKKCSVVLANFLNAKLNHKHGHRVRVGYYENTNHKGKKKDKILVAETERMQYVGYSTGPLAPRASASSKYLVGMLNKKTGKMKVYDADMFNLKPVLAAEDEVEQDEVDASMTYMEQVDRLTSAFGTTRKKRAMTSRLKNALTGEVLKSAVGSAVDEVLARQQELGVTPATVPASSGLVPPHNKDATRPQDVYQLKDIISAEEMEALKTPIKTWLNTANKDISLEGYPECVASHLQMLPLEKKSRVRKASCLMYLHYMIVLYHKKAKELSRKDLFAETLEIPDIVSKKLLDKFTVTSCNATGRTVRARPARLKDMLLSYVLVLCLILDDFNLEYTKLRKDLYMSQIKLSNHLKALGCLIRSQKVVTEDGTQDQKGFATLPVPIQFPELKKKTIKERR